MDPKQMNVEGTLSTADQLSAAVDNKAFVPKNLLQLIASNLKVLGVIFIIACISSVYYSLGLANTYRSETTLAPVQDKKNLGSLASLGGLASAAGLNIGGMGVDKSDLVVEVLKSTEFLNGFIRKHKLEAVLIAAEGWDADKKQFIFDEKIYNSSEGKWVRKATADYGVEPGTEELVREFKKILVVNKDKTTDFIKVSVETYAPEVSKLWLTYLVAEINETMKNRALKEHTETLSSIERSLVQNQNSEVRSLLFQLAEEKRKEIILAEIATNYALTTVDVPTLPERKSGPFRALIVAFSVIVGMLIYVMFCMIKLVRIQMKASVNE